MADIFLYAEPFVGDNNLNVTHFHIFDSLTDSNRLEEQKIYGLLLKFCVQGGLLESDGQNFTKVNSDNLGSFVWMIHAMNFRFLVDQRQYAMLMGSLRSNHNQYLNALVDLHVRLGCLFDHKLLNTLVNRVLQSVRLIPVDTGRETQLVDWKTIHRETPFIWLVILLQVIIRSELNKVE